MEAIRLIHVQHYDKRRKRFNRLAFNNSSDGSGASIIKMDCIRERQVTICEHIREFYSGTASDPPIFWAFDTEALPVNHQLVQQDSPSGDICHYNLLGVPDIVMKKIINDVLITSMSICANGVHRTLTFADLPAHDAK